MQQVQQMLFIEKGRLLTSIFQPPILTGELHIKDKQNFATIIGDFHQGKCESADIYRHQQLKISNIQVEIKQDIVFLGGNQISEYKYSRIKYEGGFKGYKREGFGIHYFHQYEEEKKETGIWRNGRKYGQFIEEYVDTKKQIYTILKPENQPSVNYYEIMLNKIPILATKKYQQEETQRKQLSLNEVTYWRKYVKNKKEQWKNKEKYYKKALIQQQSKVIQKVNHEQIKQQKKLTLDMAQTYIKYLYHNRQYQSKGNTIIFGIYTAFLYNKIYQINHQFTPKEIVAAKEQANHLMLQYRSKYSIFRGFWKHLIIPLVFSTKYNHFSFARITIHQEYLQCIYYDSLITYQNPKMLQFYFAIIKKALIHELLKDSKNEKRKMQIDKMEFIINRQFPQQSKGDKIYCGFYMLQGIADLMKYDKINFHKKKLEEVRREILQKLKQVCFVGNNSI